MTENEVSMNIHDHGTTLEQKGRAKCNYCGKVVSGFSRLKCHLGGIRGDVVPCERVPTYIKELMRNNLLEKNKGVAKQIGKPYHPNLPSKRNLCYQDAVQCNELEIDQTIESYNKRRVEIEFISENSGPESVSFPKRRMSSQATGSGIEDSALWNVQKCIGRFFYEAGLDFGISKSQSFQRMINASLDCDRGSYKIPTCQELKGWILQDEMQEMQMYVKEVRNSWARTGCSILLDGWNDDKGRSLINILVDCPRGAVYIRSSDISAFAGDVDAMKLFFDEVLEEVGVNNVVQIITYSTSATMEAIGKQLMDKHRTFFWTVSASHCIEMMLEKIGKMDLNKGILEKAKTITRFIHSHGAILKLLRRYSNGCGLVRPSKIRSAMPLLTLENLFSEKVQLEKMFVSPEWKASILASTSEGKRVADLVADRSFWAGATVVLKSTIPLVRVLDLINKVDKQQLGYIYETIDQAKETIKEEFRNKKSLYGPLWTAIDEIWNKYLYSPLHSAGYFLNPSLFYTSDFFTDAEVASGLLCCIVRMAEDQHVQDMITLQVDEYRVAKGTFSEGSGSNQRSDITPALWWSKYGNECPDLQRLAVRILSQTCNGASMYGLKRSLAEKLLTKGRNCIEQQKLTDLTFVHYNLQLQSYVSSVNHSIVVDEIDPMDDWITDGAQEVVCQNVGPTWMELDCGDVITGPGINYREIPSLNPKKEPR